MNASVSEGNGSNSVQTSQVKGGEGTNDVATTNAPEPTTSAVDPTTTTATTTTATTTSADTTTTAAPPTTTNEPNPTTTTTTNDRTSDPSFTTTTTTEARPTNDSSSNTPKTTTTNNNNNNDLPSSVSDKPSATITRAVTRSSAIPIISVSSDGSIRHTFTSTSYSAFVTNEATVVPTDSLSSNSSSNAGAIAGGVVGGVAGLALIGAIAFILFKRRKSKQAKSDPYLVEDPPIMDSGGKHDMGSIPPQDYNNYYENGSQYTTMSSSQGTKPRPFVQAYDPTTNTNTTATTDYTHGYDPYYQQHIMPTQQGGRNVPDEIDYENTFTGNPRLSRHVPDEV